MAETMIAQRTPPADEPNGDGWCGMPHPFAPTPEQALAELYADREAAERDVASWRAWGLAWRWRAFAALIVLGVLAASGWLVALALFLALGVG